MPSNPFAASASIPGHGNITLAILPPATPVLQTVSYQYPLKLIAPAAITLSSANYDAYSLVHTVFLLTYGGGLVGGDAVNLHVNLAPKTRLILLTQGSTKIFKSPSIGVLTAQRTAVHLARGAALCYLPDPVQPFENSAFEQSQTYSLAGPDSNLCVCDWVCEGRPARGERWSFRMYKSCNEVWSTPEAERRLLLRDNLILQDKGAANVNVFDRMEGMGVFGTLFLYGPLFKGLGDHFLNEFKQMPRIGSRQWDKPSDTAEPDAQSKRRTARLEREKADGLLWSSAATRGFVVVKFGAKEVEGARNWLRHMLKEDETIEREFGERALLCLR
jgi:urease accessory protein